MQLVRPAILPCRAIVKPHKYSNFLLKIPLPLSEIQTCGPPASGSLFLLDLCLFVIAQGHHFNLISKFVSGAQRVFCLQCLVHKRKPERRGLDQVQTLRIRFGVEQALAGLKLSSQLVCFSL